MPAASMPISIRLRRGIRNAIPNGRAWWAVLGACALGMLLFVAVWATRTAPTASDDAGAATDLQSERALAALPAPLPAAGSGEHDFGYPGTRDRGAPVRIDSHVPRQAPPALEASSAASPETAVTTAAFDLPSSVPRPVSTPPPAYPRASIRRGERGDVIVLVKVDASGGVTDVDLVSSSQHRRLDRAALAAARRWRFEPAVRDGQPVPAELRIPFSFVPEEL